MRNVIILSCWAAAVVASLTPVLSAGVFQVGDRVMTLQRVPLKDRAATRAYVDAGTTLTVTHVNDEWVAVCLYRSGKPVTGWIEQRHLTFNDPSVVQVYEDQDQLERNKAVWWKLPKNQPVIIQFSSTWPVDTFFLSEEGLGNFRWVLKNGSGSARTIRFKSGVKQTLVDWSSLGEDQYYFVADNTSFPDRGTDPRGRTNTTMRIWIRTPRPAEPSPGLGLIMGRVTLRFDGYEGRHDTYGKPLTVHLKHKAEDADDDEARKLQVLTTADGHFALANLIPERRYQVAEVQGENFRAPIPFGATMPIRSKDAKPGNRDDVLDIGYFALVVNRDGSMGLEYTSPDMQATKVGGKEGMSLRFDSSGPLERHRWFTRTYPDSGWVARVEADRDRILREREESERKKRERQAEKRRREAPAQPLAPAPPSAVMDEDGAEAEAPPALKQGDDELEAPPALNPADEPMLEAPPALDSGETAKPDAPAPENDGQRDSEPPAPPAPSSEEPEGPAQGDDEAPLPAEAVT